MEPNLNEMMQKLYGYQPKNVDPTPAIQPIQEEPMVVAQDPGKKPRPMRTVGNIESALQVQNIYNPKIPTPPKPKANPPVDMIDQGTSGALGTEGRWGTNG